MKERYPYATGTMLIDRITHEEAASLLHTYGASGASNTMPMPLGMLLTLDPSRPSDMRWTLAISPAYHDYRALERLLRGNPRLRVL